MTKLLPVFFLFLQKYCIALTLYTSSFNGFRLDPFALGTRRAFPSLPWHRCNLTMRKQKASDRRTRRRQRGIIVENDQETIPTIRFDTLTQSPMQAVGSWREKVVAVSSEKSSLASSATLSKSGGRGRSRKRSTLYNSLSLYHNHFLDHLTKDYKAEEDEVLGRINSSLDDPLSLELAGFALFDLIPQRRGNLYSDEVYRLSKGNDATTSYSRFIESDDKKITSTPRYLPANHKFGINDVIMLTLQPNGSGDYFGPTTLPTSDNAISLEARVLNHGPTYVDIATQAGSFEGMFGTSLSSDRMSSSKALRFRADKFFPNVPYQRMVAALAQLTAIPRRRANSYEFEKDAKPSKTPVHKSVAEAYSPDAAKMDETIREAILSTFTLPDRDSTLQYDAETDLQDLFNRLSKPSMTSSKRLANQALDLLDSFSKQSYQFDSSQKASIEAALTRRMTLIQGPPGSGKTAVAAAIGFGFWHQCRSISPNSKVLACAFSNVGADNLAEAMIRRGLKIVRVGKPSGVSEILWNYTLEAAIDLDPTAQKAMKAATIATSQLAKVSRDKKSLILNERTIRDTATAAVKASIKACNIAATKALRKSDVIIATSTGAADPRILAACGLYLGDDDDKVTQTKVLNEDTSLRSIAPDGLPPLSLPFVIIDEACQSVEPATLIPIVSSNTCRSIVMLGDPCQLPPTVLSDPLSPLSVSLMERLSTILPHPVMHPSIFNTVKDVSFLDTLPIKQAKSLLRSFDVGPTPVSYQKRFSGAFFLSVQYRMHPSIAAFPSAIFYDSLLSTPMFLAERRSFPVALKELMSSGNCIHSVCAVKVGGRCNEMQGSYSKQTRIMTSSLQGILTSEQTTYWNEPEAMRVVTLLKDMLRDGASDIGTIGVISPYNGQVQLIKSLIANDAELRDLLTKSPTTIEVKSVDGYQGRERDVVVFSAVRSNRHGKIGFLHDWRRMNVALTRAKSALVVVADFATLADADRYWAAFEQWVSGTRCVVDDFGYSHYEPTH